MYLRSCLHGYIPSCLVVSDVCFDFNPFLRRQVIIHSAMEAEANSRATARNSIATILHAESTDAAASSKP